MSPPVGGMPLAANSGAYQHDSLDRALAGIAAAGYRHVEVCAIPGVCEHLSLASGRGQAAVAAIADSGLVPVSIAGHTDLTTAGGVGLACRAIELCAETGAGILTTAVGGPHNEHEDEEAFLALLPSLLDCAEQHAVTVALEIHGTLTGTGAQLARLLDDVDHPLLKANYDTANADYFSGLTAVEDLPAVLPHVVHCHLKDKRGRGRVWDFPSLGEGDVDLPLLLGMLAGVRYRGPVSVEVEFAPGQRVPAAMVDQALSASLAYLDRIATLTAAGTLLSGPAEGSTVEPAAPDPHQR